MQKIEYDLPIFNDGDIADLNEYSELVANALKVQIDKFGNPLTFKGTVETLAELELLNDIKNGDIYLVKSESKNYIYNGTGWVVYSDNEGASLNILVVDTLPTENIQEKTIYLAPNTETTENNVYDEYIYVNGSWEVIGSTAVDTDNLTVNLVENSYEVTLTEAVTGGGTISLPSMYKVGFDRLDVYLNGEKLIKAETSDTEGHYYEVGTEGTLSNVIRITSDWTAEVGDVFEFTIRTNGEGEGEEIPVDTLPIGSILEYDGDTPPDGFEEVPEGEVYSTEEVRVGAWVDGKPLYRKVIFYDGAITENQETEIGYLSPNIKDVLEITYVLTNSSKSAAYFNYINNGAESLMIQVGKETGKVVVKSIGESWSTPDVFVTVTYTKTTDIGEV